MASTRLKVLFLLTILIICNAQEQLIHVKPDSCSHFMVNVSLSFNWFTVHVLVTPFHYSQSILSQHFMCYYSRISSIQVNSLICWTSPDKSCTCIVHCKESQDYFLVNWGSMVSGIVLAKNTWHTNYFIVLLLCAY